MVISILIPKTIVFLSILKLFFVALVLIAGIGGGAYFYLRQSSPSNTTSDPKSSGSEESNSYVTCLKYLNICCFACTCCCGFVMATILKGEKIEVAQSH